MKNRVLRFLIGITAAGLMVTGCSIPGLSDNANEGRTTLISEEETEAEPVEEMEAAVEFDKWYSMDTPGIPQGITASDYLKTDVDVSNLVVSESELIPSDEYIQNAEQTLLDNYASQSTDESVEAKDGDSVVITYEGVADGVTLEAYSGDSVNLRIGNGSMGSDFEEKLVGMHPGDNRNVAVTYDSNYSDTTVAGKTVIFSVTMKAIYVCDEFNDDFVAEHTNYSTVAEYEKAYKEQYRDSTMRQKAYDMVGELADTIESYPEEYLEAYKNLLKGFDELSYNQALEMEYITEDTSFDDYMDETYGEDYDTVLDDHAKSYVAQQLAFIRVGEALEINFTNENYQTQIADTGVLDTTIQRYGDGYISSTMYQQYVMNKLVDSISVKK